MVRFPWEDKLWGANIPPVIKFFPQWQAFIFRLLCLNAVIFLLPWIAHWHWLLDLGSHFQVQAVMVQIIVVLFYLLRKNRKPALISAFLLLPGIYHLSPLLGWPSSREIPREQCLRITSLNVLINNPRRQEVVDYLRAQDSDVVYLTETTNEWGKFLREALKDYPYLIVAPRDDAFGAMLFSRLPILSQKVEGLGTYRFPIIRAHLDFQGSSVIVFGIHPVPPAGRNSSRENQLYLKEVSTLAEATEGALVIAGDFNATPWSSAYRTMMRSTQLNNATEGENTFTTWNAFKHRAIPFSGLLLDHILYSEDFTKCHFETESGLGSDHFGVTVDFGLKN